MTLTEINNKQHEATTLVTKNNSYYKKIKQKIKN